MTNAQEHVTLMFDDSTRAFNVSFLIIRSDIIPSFNQIRLYIIYGSESNISSKQ